MTSRNILVLVEGAKTDVRLVKKLLRIYDLDSTFEIISYNTNIYTLYNKMFKHRDIETLDLLQTLKEYDKSGSDIFNKKYSDILLIFDLDPHDPLFEFEKIIEMTEYFNESTDNGKLYLNYPMVESFSHRYDEDDIEFMDRTVNINDLMNYKEIVNSFIGDPNKLGKTKDNMSKIILQNLEKANNIIQTTDFTYYPEFSKILDVQLDKIALDNELFVLCTCIFFIADYDKNLLH
ncbi:MAG: hypothetical protein R3Y35_12525 [Clostridia bacterium]